jgi:hypothetical protein
MAVDNASALVTAATFNGTAFGVMLSCLMNGTVTPLSLSAQGDLGDTAVGIIKKGGIATVTWVAGAGSGAFAPGTLGTLAVTAADLIGVGTQARQMTNMKALDWTCQIIERGLAIYTQNFINQSAAGPAAV